MSSAIPSAVVAAIFAVWILIAAVLVLRSTAAMRRAQRMTAHQHRLTALLETSPAHPLLVRADGRIEGTDALAKLLGFRSLPVRLAELTAPNAGLMADDLARLERAVADTRATGRPARVSLSCEGGMVSVRVDGKPAAPSIAGPGSVLLWVTEISSLNMQLRTIGQERDEALVAFASLSGLIEAAPFPMWFRNNQGAITLVNQAYVTAVESADAGSAIRDGVELVEPVGGQTAAQVAKAAQQAAQPLDRSVPVTVAGQRRIMRVVDVPLGDVGVAGYAIDTQELDDVRTENRRYATAQRDMIERLSASIAQFGPDRTLQFVNLPFRRLFNVDDALAGENPDFTRLLDHLRERRRVPEVRDYPAWRAQRADWFNLTAPVEEDWRLRDSTHLRVVGQPTADGGLLLIVEDRTEQVQLASAADTMLRVRAATFDNLYEGVAVFAPDGRLHLWNQQFRKLWDADEKLLADHPRIDTLMTALSPRLLRPDQGEIMQEVVRTATSQRLRRVGTAEFADGRIFDFSAIPLPDGNGLLIMIDVTDRSRIAMALRERNDALEAGDKIKTAFLSRMSYELRTPLTSIAGFAEMLEAGYAGTLSAPAREYIRAILDSVGVLGGHIDNVLDLAEAESGTLKMSRDTVDVGALVKDTRHRMSDLARREQVALKLSLPRGAVQCAVDPARMKQALDQVWDNAIRSSAQARKSGARVDAKVTRTDAGVEIEVADNGAGVAAELALEAEGHVGGPEFGGFGLALARQIIVNHGGTLETTAVPGTGTTVRIVLPHA